MKVLYLLRHARAVGGGAGVADFDRPLTEGGRLDARAVGRFMLKRGLRPDAVVSSPAARARETAELAAEVGRLRVGVRFDEGIYEADVGRLLAVIGATPGETGQLLLVGHNPGVGELTARLTGRWQALAPATLVRIELEAADWAGAADGGAVLTWAMTPPPAAG